MNRQQILDILHASLGHSTYPTLHDVITFIHSVPDYALPTSIAFCSYDNEINLFWDDGCSFLNMGFDGSGTYEYEGHCAGVYIHQSTSDCHKIPPQIQDVLIRFNK